MIDDVASFHIRSAQTTTLGADAADFVILLMNIQGQFYRGQTIERD